MKIFRWTPEEDAAIRSKYATIETIGDLCPKRTKKAIIRRAWQLGVQRSQEVISKACSIGLKGRKPPPIGKNQYGECKKWTLEDDEILKKEWPVCERVAALCNKLGRTKTAIRCRVCQLAIKRNADILHKEYAAAGQKNKGRKRPDLVKNRYITGKGAANLFYGKTHTPETRRVISQKIKAAGTFKRLAKNPDFQKKRIQALLASPNRGEMYIDSIIQSICPGEYKFTGDGTFIIDGLNPDWTNINGQKKVIELFGEMYHNPALAKHPVRYRSTELGRIEAFAKFGYKTLIIWGKEMKDKAALQDKIKRFNCE